MIRRAARGVGTTESIPIALLVRALTRRTKWRALEKLAIFCYYTNMSSVNIDLLLSPEEYAALPQEIRWKVPYLYTLESSDQFLSYFGASHVMNPSHPQFVSLREKFQEFLEKIKDKKSIVIYEGNVNEKNLVTLEQAIEQHGESGAIVYWANKVNIPTFRPEISIADEAPELLKEFSKDEIFYFYMIRGIVSWKRKVTPEPFEEFIVKNIERYQKELNWSDFDFSFETTKKTHKEIFGKEFSLEDEEFFAQIRNLTFCGTRVDGVSEKSCRIRDIGILKHIAKYWNEGYSIFVVYGSYHSKVQEPALRDMVAHSE